MSAAEWLDRVDALAREGTASNAPVGRPWPLAQYQAMHRAREEVCASFPAMSAALRAVLDLHRPVTHWMPHADADLSFEGRQDAVDYADGDWDPIPLVLCYECRRVEESPDDGASTRGLGYRECLYPCRTVRAIAEALT